MSGLQRPSRLPAPSIIASAKRSRVGSSTDLEEGLQSKKLRIEETPTSSVGMLSKSKSKSMMSVAGVSSGGFRRPAQGLARIPESSGRPSSVRSSNLLGDKRTPRPAQQQQGILNDRTNQSTGIAPKTKQAKKRPAWDVKGRLEDMEELFRANSERLKLLESQNSQLQTHVEEKETVVIQNSEQLSIVKAERDELEEKLRKCKRELEEAQQAKAEDAKKHKRVIEDLEFNVQSLERKIEALNDELESKMTEISGLKATVSAVTVASAGMEAKYKTAEMELQTARSEIEKLLKLCAEQKEAINVYEEKSRDYETERRKLHNLIQELKGNIRVFCRIRPLIGEEKKASGERIRHIEITGEKSMELIRSTESPNESIAGGLKGKNGKYEFEFDRVFGPDSSQEVIFDEISQLIQSAIDGYNVCVFAYGQTGSGKTHTMEGTTDDEGMIPRTIHKIFDETNRLLPKGWTYVLDASFLEIYNEEIRDLLATEKNLKYDIKMSDSSKKGDVYVTNAKTEIVTSGEQINSLLKRAQKNRAVAATNCNERSSRSHSVFTLKISGTNSITTESCQGCLNLVDLAGSERLKDSGSEGARLKETQNINKSLANLGNVIMALAQKDSHVPYRNSKLTHLLQNSLGGNSKTLMFVNISPKEECFNETLNSLRFATKVNQCHIGTATKKIKLATF